MAIQRLIFVILIGLAVCAFFWAPAQVKELTANIEAATKLFSVVAGVIAALGLNHTRASPSPGGAPPSPGGPPSPPVAPFRLAPSFESGLYGGLMGGALAGVLIGVAYYLTLVAEGERASLGLIPLIVVYAMLVGAVVGACSQLGIFWGRRAVREGSTAFWVYEVGGGGLGGAVGGALVGALAGWYIGESELPPVDLSLLVGGTLFGTIFVALGALLYDYQGRLQNVMRVILISFVLTPLLTFLGLTLMHYSGVGIIAPFGLSGTAWGAILGGVIGLVMGFQVGLTLWLYRGWAELMAPMAR